MPSAFEPMKTPMFVVVAARILACVPERMRSQDELSLEKPVVPSGPQIMTPRVLVSRTLFPEQLASRSS